jgi:hypothetical protein
LPDGAEVPTSVGSEAVYLGPGNVIWFGRIGHLHVVGRAPAETAAITIDRGHVVYAAGQRIVVVGGDAVTLDLPGRITALAAHDGRYAVDADGDLYVVTAGVPRRIGAARDVLAWSPDGKRLAPRLTDKSWKTVGWLDNRNLLVTRANEVGILPAAGGKVTRVCTAPSGTTAVG